MASALVYLPSGTGPVYISAFSSSGRRRTGHTDLGELPSLELKHTWAGIGPSISHRSCVYKCGNYFLCPRKPEASWEVFTTALEDIITSEEGVSEAPRAPRAEEVLEVQGLDSCVTEGEAWSTGKGADVSAYTVEEEALSTFEGANPSSEGSPRDRKIRKGGPKASKKVRKVNREEVVPGAIFTGKVRTITPFGAFVSFGAFSDGLVHISKLSDDYVDNVEDFVALGGEVTVTVLSVDYDSRRVALSMRSTDMQQQNSVSADESVSGDGAINVVDAKSGRVAKAWGSNYQVKKEDRKRTSKLVKGQTVQGIVKNLTRSGAFITLPEGREGFVRSSEIGRGGNNAAIETLLQVGQEVEARVLRIEKGKISLTMKQELDMKSLNELINRGHDVAATNPFELAFRQNEVISRYLAEHEKMKNLAEPVVAL